jgi:hypothetical protein
MKASGIFTCAVIFSLFLSCCSSSPSYSLKEEAPPPREMTARDYALQGEDAFFRGDYATALENYAQAAATESGDADYYFMRGLSSYKLRKDDLGRADFEMAVSLEPEHIDANYFLSYLNNMDEAVSDFDPNDMIKGVPAYDAGIRDYRDYLAFLASLDQNGPVWDMCVKMKDYLEKNGVQLFKNKDVLAFFQSQIRDINVPEKHKLTAIYALYCVQDSRGTGIWHEIALAFSSYWIDVFKRYEPDHTLIGKTLGDALLWVDFKSSDFWELIKNTGWKKAFSIGSENLTYIESYGLLSIMEYQFFSSCNEKNYTYMIQKISAFNNTPYEKLHGEVDYWVVDEARPLKLEGPSSQDVGIFENRESITKKLPTLVEAGVYDNFYDDFNRYLQGFKDLDSLLSEVKYLAKIIMPGIRYSTMEILGNETEDRLGMRFGGKEEILAALRQGAGPALTDPKYLVLVSDAHFSTETVDFYIYYMLMLFIPYELLPESLAEVNRIIQYDYTFGNARTYYGPGTTATGYSRMVKGTVREMPDDREIAPLAGVSRSPGTSVSVSPGTKNFYESLRPRAFLYVSTFVYLRMMNSRYEAVLYGRR